MGKCTLADIAKRCGVATYTVSRAINNKKDISLETKEKILKVAKEMGYTTNITAKNLRVGNTNNIAIVYDDFENPYYNALIKRFSHKLNEKGYSTTMFYDFDSISLLNTKLLKRVISTNVSGIISFMNVTDNAKKFNSLVNIPIVQIGIESSSNDIDCVFYDDIDGGYKIASYLISKGYKNLGFINATYKLKSGMNRIKGANMALFEHKLNKLNVINMTDDDLSIDKATQKLINENVDAIICFSDMTALLAIKYLKSINNKQIKIAGFDNLNSFFPITNNLLSSYGDMDKMVDISINILLDKINNKENEYQKIKLPMMLNE